MACCFGNLKQTVRERPGIWPTASKTSRATTVPTLSSCDTGMPVLPGRVLRVQHEDVVDDLEGNVRRLLDYCELEFEPACVEFHKTERSVRTASSEQVPPADLSRGSGPMASTTNPGWDPCARPSARRSRATATRKAAFALRLVAEGECAEADRQHASTRPGREHPTPSPMVGDPADAGP